MSSDQPTEDGEKVEPDEPRPRPPRRVLLALVIPIVVLIVISNLGDLFTTTLADKHPLVLTLLNSRNRVLLLTTNQMDAFSFYTAAGLRLLLSDPLFYLLGFFYGDGALRWVERKSSTFGEQLRLFERLFKRASYPMVFIAPNNLICLFAGASGMSVPAFFAVNISGTAARLYLIRSAGETFESPIDSVLDFFKEYRLPLFIASAVLLAFSFLMDRRKGGGELEGILDLEREIESEIEADES